MKKYKKLYLYLFNKVTDAIRLLEQKQCREAKDVLIAAQRECEDIYIEMTQSSDT